MKKKYRLTKPINELVDDTLNMIHGDEPTSLSNVKSKKTMDSRIQATTQNWSYNKKTGQGGEYYQDPGLSINEDDVEENDDISLSESKARKMIEDILSKRTGDYGLDVPTSIPPFEQMKQEHPILSRYTTVLIDRITNGDDKIEEYGATILSEIMDALDLDSLSQRVKKVLINKIKGLGVTNTV